VYELELEVTRLRSAAWGPAATPVRGALAGAPMSAARSAVRSAVRSAAGTRPEDAPASSFLSRLSEAAAEEEESAEPRTPLAVRSAAPALTPMVRFRLEAEGAHDAEEEKDDDLLPPRRAPPASLMRRLATLAHDIEADVNGGDGAEAREQASRMGARRLVGGARVGVLQLLHEARRPVVTPYGKRAREEAIQDWALDALAAGDGSPASEEPAAAAAAPARRAVVAGGGDALSLVSDAPCAATEDAKRATALEAECARLRRENEELRGALAWDVN